MINRTTILWIG